DHELHTGAVTGGDHLVRQAQVEGYRLLDEDVHTGLGGRHRRGVMHGGGRRYRDGVYATRGEHLTEVRVRPVHAPGRRPGRELDRVDVAQRDDVRAGGPEAVVVRL